MNNEIKIPLSKKKILLLFFGAVIIVIIGIWFLLEPEQFLSIRRTNETLIQTVGISATIFFGFCAVFAFKKLFDKKYGLIINENGIVDNSNATSVGLIKWTDIVGVRIEEVYSQKFMLIDVKNPEEYIEQKKGKAGKVAMKANYNIYGSPISITSNSLKFDFSELEKIIHKQLEKHTSHLNIQKPMAGNKIENENPKRFMPK